MSLSEIWTQVQNTARSGARQALRLIQPQGSGPQHSHSHDGRLLVIGFVLVMALLLMVGAVGWIIISSQNRSFDRYGAAGQLMTLMDEARLSELTFTRDGSEEAIQSTNRITAEVLALARTLQKDSTYADHSELLVEAIAAMEDYQRLFKSYVTFRKESNRMRAAMVDAAIEASASATDLQLIQEKYIQLDTESVRQFRREAEKIAENTANSYEIVIFVEQALEHEKNFLLTGRIRDIEYIRSVITSLKATIDQLLSRVKDPKSLQLLDEIDQQKDNYLLALEALEKSSVDGTRLALNSAEVLTLDRAAFAMRDAAFALRSNERSVLSSIQDETERVQELMARRLALSEEVHTILMSVSEARQADRDFLLAQSLETREVLAAQVLTQLDTVISRANKIQTLLIEEDEKRAFQNVVPSIRQYRHNFERTVEVSLEAASVGQEMVAAAIRTDRVLKIKQEHRLSQINDAREWAGILGPLGIIFAAGIILMALFMRKAQEKLTRAYDLVSSSIDYASNIQKSLLADEQSVFDAVNQHFTVWKPRDVVGGDLYWIRDWGEGKLVCVGDCTGHGVPGAMMTVIATGALDRAVTEVPPGDLSGLLATVHTHIQSTLGRSTEDALADDGMEAAVLYIRGKDQTILFSGARLPLFARSGKEIKQIRGTRQGLGYRDHSKRVPFEQFEIDPKDYDALYLATDGVFDQTGGEDGHGFGKRRFAALLAETHGMPLSSAGAFIMARIEEYQGSHVRRDDICIFGLKT